MNGEIISLETARKLAKADKLIQENVKLKNSSELYESLYKIEYKRRTELQEELNQEKIYHDKYIKLCNKIKELKEKKHESNINI